MFDGQLSEIGSILFMAFALGLDGFSVSLGIGMQNIRLRRIVMIGFIIGLFHMLLPFIGISFGQFLSEKLEDITSVIGGFILVFIGSYMIFSALQPRAKFIENPAGIQLLSVAFIVSIDSLPVGISLGISGVATILIIFLFGICTMILSWIGLIIGKKAHSVLGMYSEIVGGIILFLLGINVVFVS